MYHLLLSKVSPGAVVLVALQAGEGLHSTVSQHVGFEAFLSYSSCHTQCKGRACGLCLQMRASSSGIAARRPCYTPHTGTIAPVLGLFLLGQESSASMQGGQGAAAHQSGGPRVLRFLLWIGIDHGGYMTS